MRYYNDRAEASSAVNMALIKVLKHRNRWKENTSFDAWIKKIYINQAIDAFRKRRSERSNLKEWFDHKSIELVNVSTESDVEHIKNVIAGLPEMHRMVFNLFVEEGFNHAEIGKTLNISVENSRFYLFDARRRIKHKLEANGLSSTK